ncbi:MAG: DUF72 domain-containing protein [Candidatus Dormibacteraceae bacterium]
MGSETAGRPARVRATVRGSVQGVGFRYWVQRQARVAGVMGWVRNQPDGSVECLLQGPSAGVDQMVAKLRQGPRMASVETVDLELEAALDDLREPVTSRSSSSRRGRLRVGTSGWQYRHWRGVFYPEGLPQRAWFGFYATHFDTVEVNNTFYRLPAEPTFGKWEERAPPGFRYALKGSRFITHLKRLREAKAPLAEFARRAGAIEVHRGPVLWQLPPVLARDDELLRLFLASLPAGFRHTVEFRHRTWLDPAVFAMLRERSVALCVPDRPGLSRSLELTAAWTYLRFHAGAAGGDYTEAQLEEWSDRIAGWLEEGVSVWAYFNNDQSGYAISNARRLLERIRQRRPDPR